MVRCLQVVDELEIRKNLIEQDMVECIVTLPGQLFYSTQIPVCLWFMTKNKAKMARMNDVEKYYL